MLSWVCLRNNYVQFFVLEEETESSGERIIPAKAMSRILAKAICRSSLPVAILQTQRKHSQGSGGWGEEQKGLAALACSLLLPPSPYPCHFILSCPHRPGCPFSVFFSRYTSTCSKIDPRPLPSKAGSWFRGERETQVGISHFPRKMPEKVAGSALTWLPAVPASWYPCSWGG